MVLGALDRRVGWFHAGQHLAPEEHFGVLRQVGDDIDIGWHPYVRHPAQHGMVL